MTDTDLSALTARMETSSTGYGAVIDGVLNIRTVSDTKRAVAVNCLFMSGVTLVCDSDDPECDCAVKALAQFRPDIRIIPVKVEAT